MAVRHQWLKRLDEGFAWLNARLVLVATILMLLNLLVAVRHVSVHQLHQPVATPEAVPLAVSVACPRPALSPELQDMLNHD